MSRKNLSEWLAWQETLNPAEIDLGLERVRSVAEQLQLAPPEGRVITIAGTNGKGSTAATIDALLRAGGLKTGIYTSPHLIRYNERVCVAGKPVDDEQLVAAFEAIESVRGETSLTFFEYGTLAAMLIFSQQECDAWVLEIGLGGRLDAVNIIDPDVAVITTVDLDHQEWLGDTIEAIAAEKAGIMRAEKPVFYGDVPVPQAIRVRATEIKADLFMADQDFDTEIKAAGWDWRGRTTHITDLPLPVSGGAAQVRNQSLALAVIECLDEALMSDKAVIQAQLIQCLPRGRGQLYSDAHNWLLDVAHNPQSAQVLRETLLALDAQPMVIIVGMLADKEVGEFCGCLDDLADHWLSCATKSGRGASADALADQLRAQVSGSVTAFEAVPEAMSAARGLLPEGGLIVVCGSFQVVGPALEQLGLY